MSAADTELLHVLREIAAKLDELPNRIANATRESGTSLTKADRETLAELLPRISHQIGDAQFAIADAMTEEPELRHALESAVGDLDAQRTRSLGKLFARADGFMVDGGYRIERTGKSRSGVLWRVSALKDHRIPSQTREPA